MKNLIAITLLISSITFSCQDSKSQTYSETVNWIANNAYSDDGMTKNQVLFSEKKDLIYIISIFVDNVVYFNEFNSKNVSSIRITKNRNGLYDLSLQFSNSTTIELGSAAFDNSRGSRWTLNTIKDDKFVNWWHVQEGKIGATVKLNCNLKKAERVKNAYINLFKTINHKVKDEDNMF